MSLPIELENLLEGMECIVDDEGQSRAQVKKYYDMNKAYYLKIEQVNSEVEREIGMYQWIKGRLPVPAILYQAIIAILSIRTY
jgi:kanamycin kinase/aminoglycoside 3'-phosphotransferase-3